MKRILLTMWLVAVSFLVLGPPDVLGQNRRREEPFPFQFSSPDQFFEQFFAGPNQEDDETLARIAVSKGDEFQFGAKMVDAFVAELKRNKVKITTRGSDVDYLSQLVGLLRPSLRNAARYPKLVVHVVESSEPDARSFPGGTLFFYRGMLELAGSEAALVGVIGHELSHLDNGHQLVPLKQSKLIEQSFAGGGSFDVRKMMNAGAMMSRLMSRPFRPQDEAVADRDGTAWAYQAGYDPREMSALLLRMSDKARGPGIAVPAFLRTHPPSLERSESVLRQFAELQKADPRPTLYVGRTNLERRVTRREREFPE